MKTVNFCFATHNHQPIGNFDHIIEEAYQHSYLPFFNLAEKHSVKFGAHFTGILIDWLSRNHPEHIDLLRSMVTSGQLEMISGGYYEPILSVLPAADQASQIHKLTSAIKEHYGYSASGMWLAERVWEQPLASALHDASIHYVLLDDTHFLAAGLSEEKLNGYYLTEDQGKSIAVFPISKALRYTIPFASVDDTIKVLRDASTEEGNTIVCFADDGEKFGVWPRTFDHVYGEGWLEEFLTKLEENAAWIKTIHFSEALKQFKPVGRIYLPNASYSEMMQWALPTSESNQGYDDFLHLLDEDKEKWQPYRTFVRGGYWRNFFVKYPEANQLHKHMLRTSGRLAKLGRRLPVAEDLVLKSQCNDPYWHGVFGGVYLTNLRHANYSALLEADGMLDQAEGSTGLRLSVEDLDCDGFDEVILESEVFSLFVKPSAGGSIVELDFKPRSFNATNSVSRQKEAYHAKLAEAGKPRAEDSTKSIHDLIEAKEEGLQRHLIYDWYRHGCLIDHFVDPTLTHAEFSSMKYSEIGDFVTSAYDWSFKDNTLRQHRSGSLSQGDSHVSLQIDKALTVKGRQLDVTYSITNESEELARFRFGSEWMFNLLAGDAHDRYYESDGKQVSPANLSSSGLLEANNIRLVDEYLQLAIRIVVSSAACIWRVPIESVSLSEGGFERVYQGSIVMPLWDSQVESKGKWETSFTVTFEEL